MQVWLKDNTEVGLVISPIHYSYVKKGLCDVKMVYNGTGCGLNGSIWAPHVGLPIVWHTLCSLLPGYSQYDLDIREMFLNFVLNDTMKEMAGVVIQHVCSKAILDLEWERGRSEG